MWMNEWFFRVKNTYNKELNNESKGKDESLYFSCRAAAYFMKKKTSPDTQAERDPTYKRNDK